MTTPTTAAAEHRNTILAAAATYYRGDVGERIPLATDGMTPGFTAYQELLEPHLDELNHFTAWRYGPRWAWVLRGPAGAIALEAGLHRTYGGICTDCRRYPTIREVDHDGRCWRSTWVDAHSVRPLHDDHSPAQGGADCPYTGRPCYVDGSPLQAQLLVQRWLATGRTETAMVTELRNYYDSWLGER